MCKSEKYKLLMNYMYKVLFMMSTQSTKWILLEMAYDLKIKRWIPCMITKLELG